MSLALCVAMSTKLSQPCGCSIFSEKAFILRKKEKKCPVSLVDPSEDLICVTSTEETCCLF